MSDSIPHRLAAIFAADVAGYSHLMETNEEETLRQLTACREIMDGVVGQHRGRVVNSVGDSVLAEFGSTTDALAAAASIQKRIAEQIEGPATENVRFRIGLHLGEVMVRGNDIYGNGVNIAARLQVMAEPGGIVVSGAVFDLCKRLPYRFDPLGTKPMKNIEEPVSAYRVVGVQEASQVSGRSTSPASRKTESTGIENRREGAAADTAVPRPTSRQDFLLLYLAGPVLSLLVAHHLIVNSLNLETVYLRIASFVIPLPFGFVTFWRDKVAAGVASTLGTAVGFVAVAGMTVSESLNSGQQLIPATAFEWRENIEYAATIALSLLTGHVLARILHKRWKRPEGLG